MVEIEIRKAEIPEQKKPNALKRFWKFIRGGDTPKEKEVSSAYEKTKSESRNALRSLSEDTEKTKRSRIDALRKVVVSVSDIAQSREATRAYQELILLTNPARFYAEIRKIDGVCGPKTRAAYDVDKQVLSEPRKNFWQRLFLRTPKPEEPEKKKPETPKEQKKSPTPRLSEWTVGGGSIKSSPYEKSSNGVTLCSGTGRKNLYKFVPSVPSGDADIVAKTYQNGARFPNMLGFTSGEFNPPEGANVVDLLLDTPKLPHYARDYGHRAVAYKEKWIWYALDPYYGRCGTQPIPLGQYLAGFNRPGYAIRGAAYYTSNRIA